jgi:hypothetical protein
METGDDNLSRSNVDGCVEPGQVHVIAKSVKFCSAFYLSHIIDPLLAALKPDWQHPFRKLVIHLDNARTHASVIVGKYFESQRLWWADDPLHSPDLAPSDFFLFGLAPGQLKVTHFPDGQALICEMRRLLSELPPEMLRSTFGAWMDHLERKRPSAETTSTTEHKAEAEPL